MTPRPWHAVTVNYHTAHLLPRWAASLGAAGTGIPPGLVPPPLAAADRLWIVNNSPSDRDLAERAAAGQLGGAVVLETGENLGFGRACNRALREIWRDDRRAVAWLLNPDAWLLPDAMAIARELLARRDAPAVLGSWVCGPDGSVEFGGGRFERRSGAILPEIPQPTLDLLARYDACAADAAPPAPTWQRAPWVSGCSLVLDLARFDACPQFDPNFFLYYEDFDLCRRCDRAGHVVAVSPAIVALHETSTAAGRDPFRQRRAAVGSYLLALEKHAFPLAWAYRLARLTLSAIAQLPRDRPRAIAKLAALGDYLAGIPRRARSRDSPERPFPRSGQ